MPEAALTMANLTDAIFASRERFVVPEQELSHYVKTWEEEDHIDGKPAPARTVVLRTRGCTWDYKHGCTMCGYFNETAHQKVTGKQIVAQYEGLEPMLAGKRVLKIYTGGTFPDPTEVDPAAQDEIVARAAKHVEKITMEARPEYCTPERMKALAEAAADGGAVVEIAIGLESSSDLVCHQAINKGYGFAEFVEAARVCHENGMLVKAYLLLKPPFLTEHETVEDMVSSIRDAAAHCDTISVNPTNVQKFTLVEKMWEAREYRPPWLWSVLEVLKRGKHHAGAAVLKSDPVGGGKARGAHNCGSCDDEIMRRIDQYNQTQDIAFVEAALKTSCACRREYDAVIRLEGYLVGGFYV